MNQIQALPEGKWRWLYEAGTLECLLQHVSFFLMFCSDCVFFFFKFAMIISSIGFYSVNYLYLTLFYKL